MACSPDIHMHQMMECSVCLIKYVLPNRTPKNLSCGHTFCLACLTSLAEDKKLTCPTCRAESKVPDSGIKGLPSNHSVIGMLETLCTSCLDRFKQEKCPHCDQLLCLNCIEEHNSNLLDDNKTSLNSLKRTINDMEPDLDTNTNIKTVLEEFCEKRINVLSSIKAEQKEFKEKQHLEKLALKEKQKLEKIEFLNTSQQHQHDLLADFDKSQKLKIQKIMEYGDKGSEHITLWKEEIESESKELDKGNLSTQQLLTVTSTVAKLRSEIMEFNKSGSSNCFVGQTQLSLKTEPDPCSTLTYYKSINKPSCVVYGIGQIVPKYGYFNATTCPKDGDIYVCDWGGKCIVKLSESGSHLATLASNHRKPSGVVVCNDDIILSCQSEIITFNKNGQILNTEGQAGDSAGEFSELRSLAFCKNGTLYAADRGNKRIQYKNPGGMWTVLSVFTDEVTCVVEYSDDIVLVATGLANPILWKLYSDGSRIKLSLIGDKLRRRTKNGFYQMCVDKDGYIIIAYAGGDCILVIDIDGIIHCKIGSYGSLPGQFNTPAGVCLTRDGKLVVTEFYNIRIQIF